MVAGCSEVTAPKKYRHPRRQRNAHRKRISAPGLVDGGSQHTACVVGEATQPQRARQANRGVDAMVKPEELRSYRARLGHASHASLTVKLSCGLVSHEMIASAEHEIRDDRARRVLGVLPERCALLRSRERGTEIAQPHEKPIQAVKKPQLVSPV